MRKTKPGLLILAIAALALGCGPKRIIPDGMESSRNFVQVYIIPSEIFLYAADAPRNRYIGVVFIGHQVNNRQVSMKEEYDRLAEKYDDTTYDGKLFPDSNRALGRDISAINITCDTAFDEDHPAGESLGDVVMLCANSYKMFVESGYDRSYTFPGYVDEHWCFERKIGLYPIFKPLEDVTRDDLVLIEPAIFLYFAEVPAPGDYEFSIEVRSGEDEESLTGKVTVSFE